jgi:hypothetical protein
MWVPPLLNPHVVCKISYHIENRISKEEWNTVKDIKENGLIITNADKGETLVIMELQKCQQYIQESINEKTAYDYNSIPQRNTKKQL